MDMKQKYSAGLLLILIAGTAWLKWKGHPSVTEAPATNVSAGVNPFTAPYGWQTPGIADNAATLNGGAPFQSTVNVDVNPSYLGTLSQQFIPLFGFVGLGVDPAMQGSSSQLVAPALPAASFVSASQPPVSSDPFSQPAPNASSQPAIYVPPGYASTVSIGGGLSQGNLMASLGSERLNLD